MTLFGKTPGFENLANYTDFSKAFDTVLPCEPIEKCAEIGVGGSLLELLINYLKNRKQYVNADHYRSSVEPVKSGVLQGSILASWLFCIFINDLTDVSIFSSPFMYADDLKILYVGNTHTNIQSDLNNVMNSVESNKMAFAADKCKQLVFCCQSQIFCVGE